MGDWEWDSDYETDMRMLEVRAKGEKRMATTSSALNSAFGTEDVGGNPSNGPLEITVTEDFGFTTVDNSQTVKSYTVNIKLDEIKKKIEPFLNNLAKNPSQDIHWPDRDKRIARFKKELWEIIDG